MSPRGGLAQSLGEPGAGLQDGVTFASPGDFAAPYDDGYAPPRRIRLVAYGARLESGLGVKALRGSNPLSSAGSDEAAPTITGGGRFVVQDVSPSVGQPQSGDWGTTAAAGLAS